MRIRTWVAALSLAAGAALATLAPHSRAQEQPPAPGDEAVEVTGLLSARGEAPLPIVGAGAPNYSPEQTASFLCEQLGSAAISRPSPPPPPPSAIRNDPRFRGLQSQMAQQRRSIDVEAIALERRREALQRAHQATLTARDVRRRAFAGQATEAQMVRAELDRQEAVRVLGAAPRVSPSNRILGIEDLKRERVLENGRAVLVVSGRVRNLTGQTIDLPPLTVQAIDVRGFVLAGQSEALPKESLAAGEMLDFTLRFRNPPHYTADLVAAFAPPFGVRNFRGCEFLDPLSFDAQTARISTRRTRPVPVPEVGEGAPRYEPDELAALARDARLTAQAAFAGDGDRCAPLQPWRPWLIAAVLMDEAWSATTAAEEARRDAARDLFLPEEVAEAELARQRAVRAFMAARPPARTVRPGEAPGLSIERVTLSETRADTLRIRGQVKNSARTPAVMPALFITVVDRFGFVTMETRLEGGEAIPAGRSQAFSVEASIPRSLAQDVRVVFTC